jgi:hypothetical protein
MDQNLLTCFVTPSEIFAESNSTLYPTILGKAFLIFNTQEINQGTYCKDRQNAYNRMDENQI